MRAPESLTITAADGVPLVGRLFAPAAAPRGAVLRASVMGVPQRHYEPLAAWLARQGFLVTTFDYRGTGLSRRGSLRREKADLFTWAEQDCAAALRTLGSRADGLPLTWLGHSLGGQILPFVPGHERAARVVTVASGSGYWRDNTPALRRRVWLLWWLAAPVSMALLGWFPGRALRMVGDLPRGVMAQWPRWCLHPEYAVGVEGERARARYAAVGVPVTSLSFTDDEYMSARNVEALHAQYTGASRRMVRVAPAEVGVRRIGHFGFFHPRHEPLWDRLLLPELAALPGGSGPA
jgi:predicted alpha/beta hydrolase